MSTRILETTLSSEIGAMMRDKRMKRHFTKDEIGRTAELPVETIADMEAGKTDMTVAALLGYCKRMGMTPNQILGFCKRENGKMLLDMLPDVPEAQKKPMSIIPPKDGETEENDVDIVGTFNF